MPLAGTIPVVPEDRLATIAAGGDVIDASGELDAKRPGHSVSLGLIDVTIGRQSWQFEQSCARRVSKGAKGESLTLMPLRLAQDVVDEGPASNVAQAIQIQGLHGWCHR